VGKSITIFGDGPGSSANDSGTLLIAAAGGNTDAITFTDAVYSMVTIRDLKIDGNAFGAAPATKTSVGIYADVSANRPGPFYFHNLVIRNCGRDGFWLRGVNWPYISQCNVIDNAERGIHLSAGTGGGAGGCILSKIVQCHVAGNNYQGIFIEPSGLNIIAGCGLEGNCGSAADTTYNGQIEIKTSHDTTVMNCDFETWNQTTVKRALVVYDSKNINIFGNSFSLTTSGGSPTYRASTTSISVYGNDESGCYIGPNTHEYVETAVDIDNATGGRTNYGLILLEQGYRNYAATPPTHATLMKYPTGANADNLRQVIWFNGLRLPQWTAAAKPAAAAGNAGMLIYVRDGGAGAVLQFSDGSSWINVA